jgi:hypothetical protein
MNLSIKVSRLSNLLFFASKTNKADLVSHDLQKYLLSEQFNLSFYGKSENEIWKQIEKIIGKGKTKEMKKSILSLNLVFIPYWHKASKNLFLWKQYFQKNQYLFQEVIIKLKKLIGVKSFAISKIPVYLISDPLSKDKEINAWFSWMPKQSFIVIEIPFNLKIPNNFFPLAVLVHEFFHLILRKNKNLFLKITDIAKKNDKLFAGRVEDMPNRIFLEELLISSFIPEGYLSKKYFNTKIVSYTSKPKDLLEWRKFVAFKLYQLAKKYIDNNRQIDENYFKYLIRAIKQN